jgi:hypothetical protein
MLASLLACARALGRARWALSVSARRWSAGKAR